MPKFVKPGSIKICFPKEKIPRLPENGEYYLGVFSMKHGRGNLYPLKKKGLGIGWCAVYGDYATEIAKWRLTGEEMRVLFKLLELLAKVGVENRLLVNHKTNAQEMGLHPTAFSRAIRTLRERYVIIEDKPTNGIKTYLLNPHFAYKGKNRDDMVREFDKLLAEKIRSETGKAFATSVSQTTDKDESSKDTVKFLGIRNPDTDEYILCPLKAKTLGIDWCAVYGNFAAEIANSRLTGEEIRVFFRLLAEVEFGNRLIISQVDIAQELGLHPSAFSKAMRGLREWNIIVEEKRIGKAKTYRLNPFFAHKGKNRDETIKEFGKLLDEKRDDAKK